MNTLFHKSLLIAGSLMACTASLWGADAPADAAPVPEPSVTLIGGLCGILFLFWRRK